LDGLGVEVENLLSFSIASLIAGLVFGTIGFWVWRQAKIRENKSLRIVGLVLMLYSYVTPGPLSDWTFGILLCALAKYLW